MQGAPGQFGGAPRTEGAASGGGERDHPAPGEHVRGRGGGVPGVAFRAHPPGGAEQRPLGAHPLVGESGDPEVQDLRAVGREDDVAGFEVAVHHSGRVDRRERLGDARREPQQQVSLQRAVFAHVGAERPPRHEVGGHPRPFGVGVGRVHGGSAQPAHPAHQRDLPGEARPKLRLGGELGVHDLDRDARVPPVQRAEHRTHAALPEPPHHPVGADPGRIARPQRTQLGGQAGQAVRGGGSHRRNLEDSGHRMVFGRTPFFCPPRGRGPRGDRRWPETAMPLPGEREDLRVCGEPSSVRIRSVTGRRFSVNEAGEEGPV